MPYPSDLRSRRHHDGLHAEPYQACPDASPSPPGLRGPPLPASAAGTALATAIWVPNIEFIFGLTGATASVLLSYILPAITFIRLMDLNPELLGGGNFKVIPESIR